MEKLTGKMLREVWELLVKYAPEEELLKLVADEFDATDFVSQYCDLAEVVSGFDAEDILNLIDNVEILDYIEAKMNLKEYLEERRYNI